MYAKTHLEANKLKALICLIICCYPVEGGDEAAAEVLQCPGGADEPHLIETSVVHHDRTVSYEVRLEWKWSGYGRSAHHHCNWLC